MEREERGRGKDRGEERREREERKEEVYEEGEWDANRREEGGVERERERGG